jgi:hypothetical protein
MMQPVWLSLCELILAPHDHICHQMRWKPWLPSISTYSLSLTRILLGRLGTRNEVGRKPSLE